MTDLSKHIEEINMREGKEILNQEVGTGTNAQTAN